MDLRFIISKFPYSRTFIPGAQEIHQESHASVKQRPIISINSQQIYRTNPLSNLLWNCCWRRVAKLHNPSYYPIGCAAVSILFHISDKDIGLLDGFFHRGDQG